MKKWYWLAIASIVALGCGTPDSKDGGTRTVALGESVVDSPPPSKVWAEDPDYQEEQSQFPPPAQYDSSGRRIAPAKVVTNPLGPRFTPGKGTGGIHKPDQRLLDSLDREAMKKKIYWDSVGVARQREMERKGGK